MGCEYVRMIGIIASRDGVETEPYTQLAMVRMKIALALWLSIGSGEFEGQLKSQEVLATNY